MPRDRGLESLIDADLREVANLSGKAMFGGWAWLVDGNLLCGARTNRLMVRLGKDRDGWALQLPGARAVEMGERKMPGWVWF
ncbi:MAG: hypothetical protein KDA61_22190, partial [Planctomycetales bacterium]|nr:hypothetical protein [Planctomycetales bacterium]